MSHGRTGHARGRVAGVGSRLAWLLAAAALLWAGPASGQPVVLTVGAPGASLPFLTLHVAAEHTAAAEGLTVRVVTFDGPAAVATAVASGSVDVGALSLNTVLGVIGAGHPVRVFWAVAIRSDLEWFGRGLVRTWGDLRGRSIGVGTPGSTIDVLTRHVLRRQGLEPGRDVQVVTGGSSRSRLAALRAGRLDATLLAPPLSWEAEAAGFARLGDLRTTVSETWPEIVLAARRPLLDEREAAVRALVRACVRATRWVRAHRDETMALMVGRLGFLPQHAARGYEEALAGLHERGALPADGMRAFWDVAVAAGEVDAPWPEARFFDRRFVDAFEAWAPR